MGNPSQMFDSVNLDAIPKNAPVVAGYVGGAWPTYFRLAARFPKARLVSIAISDAQDADALDIEHGDATAGQAPAWVFRMHSRGLARPILYASLSNMGAVIDQLASAGIQRDSVRLWVADYTDRKHVPPSPRKGWGFDACQWTCTAGNLALDESVLLPSFWPPRGPSVRAGSAAKVKAVHPKTAAAAGGGTLAAGLVALAQGLAGTHLTPTETAAIAALAAVLASYGKRA